MKLYSPMFGIIAGIILTNAIQNGEMTVEQFEKLSEDQKGAAIFDAEKVTERFDKLTKYELFQIDNFFIETKTCVQRKLKRVIATFRSKELPGVYQ